MLLILSASWAGGGIETHYGRLPIAFLPFGSERLLHAQRQVAPTLPCIVAIPDDFDPSEWERRSLKSAGFQLLRLPATLPPSESLKAALQCIAPVGPLQVLLGGTLTSFPDGVSLPQDSVAVAASYPGATLFYSAGAPRARFVSSADSTPGALAVCGHFHFSDGAAFVAALQSAELFEALNAYEAQRSLAAVAVESHACNDTLGSYMQAKSKRLVARAFNTIALRGNALVKTSVDAPKMEAEAIWYETLPSQLRPFVPQYRGREPKGERAGYQTTLLDLPTVGELSAFARLRDADWEAIIGASHELLQAFHAIRPHPGGEFASPAFASHFHGSMVVSKTRSRLDRYLTDVGSDCAITLNGRQFPPLRFVADRLIDSVRPTRPDDVRFWHGDFHFANLLVDVPARRIFCVDPRGLLDDGTITSFGDWRYDIAKLAHSVIGHYDRITLGGATLECDGPLEWRFEVAAHPEDQRLEAAFLELCRTDLELGEGEILPLSALLFLSMLPLHADRPQMQRMFISAGLSLAARSGILS